MLYPLIFSAVVFYLAMSHVSYKYFVRVRKAWFGDNCRRFKAGEVVEAAMWPFTLPVFYGDMHKEIKLVNEGYDWADFNIPPDRQEIFRSEFMRIAP